MQTLDEMLSLQLLTPDQHTQICDWVRWAKTPEAILDMPPPLWQALERASVLMDFDASLGPAH